MTGYEVLLFVVCLWMWMWVGFVYGKTYSWRAGYITAHLETLAQIEEMKRQYEAIEQFKRKDKDNEV